MELTLKQLRVMNNITQVEAAKRLNVNPQTYNAWEQLSDEMCDKIAHEFNAKPVSNAKFFLTSQSR